MHLLLLLLTCSCAGRPGEGSSEPPPRPAALQRKQRQQQQQAALVCARAFDRTALCICCCSPPSAKSRAMLRLGRDSGISSTCSSMHQLHQSAAAAVRPSRRLPPPTLPGCRRRQRLTQVYSPCSSSSVTSIARCWRGLLAQIDGAKWLAGWMVQKLKPQCCETATNSGSRLQKRAIDAVTAGWPLGCRSGVAAGCSQCELPSSCTPFWAAGSLLAARHCATRCT